MSDLDILLEELTELQEILRDSIRALILVGSLETLEKLLGLMNQVVDEVVNLGYGSQKDAKK